VLVDYGCGGRCAVAMAVRAENAASGRPNLSDPNGPDDE
jgi:hypothetical protein